MSNIRIWFNLPSGCSKCGEKLSGQILIEDDKAYCSKCSGDKYDLACKPKIEPKKKVKRDWNSVNRTCISCGCKFKQGEMVRANDGWYCESCLYDDDPLSYIEDDF